MCGIAGVIFKDKPVSESILKKMTDAIAHRGPDASGFFLNEGKNVGLGHRRLSIIDLSEAANQPFFSSCGRYVMVYNGEVYNYKEVASQLDVSLKTNSDTEVVLEAFAKWGPSFVSRLNGMFALAIYDQKKHELFLLRDRFGIKPLFYFQDQNTFAFASETKALLQLDISRDLNLNALNDYLFLEYIPENQSIFKNIHKLSQGSYLIVNNEGVQTKQYYDVLDQYQPNTGLGEAEHLDNLYGRLKDAVGLRKISDVPIGAFLSGGADSSLICSVFQEISESPINTFNIGFEKASFDESVYARQVADVLKTVHTSNVAGEDYALQFYQDVVKYYDEPFAAPSTFPTMLVCNRAKQKVTVALSGDGGDELFMGYGYYNWMDRFNRMDKFGGRVGRQLAAKLMSLSGKRMERAARIFDYGDADRAWLHIWSQEQYMFSEKEISQLMGAKYTNQSLVSDWNRINSMEIHPYEKISLFDIRHYLANNLLYKVDIASMYASLEVRVPFLDHNLIEYAINVPVHLKVNQGTQKYIQKKMLERFLPKELVHRTKWGFPAPVSDWLLNGLGFLIDETLNEKTIRKQGIFDPYFVNNLVSEFKSGKAFHYKRVWALVFFQLWYNNYFEQKRF